MAYKAEYSRGMNKSILMITQENNSDPEKDCIEMFRYNEIPYFLKMQMKRKDGAEQFCYDITGRKSLDQLLEFKALGYQLLHNILNAFDQACIQAGEYMLAENDILPDPAVIFVENGTERIQYCYLPGNQADICVRFREFMEYLLKRLDHKDEQAVQLAYGVHQRVTEEKAALHAILAEFRKGGNSLKRNHSIAYSATDRQPPGVQAVQEMESRIEKIPVVQESESQQQEQVSADRYVDETAQMIWKDVSCYRPSKAEQKNSMQSRRKAEKLSKLQQKETEKQPIAEKLKNLLRKKIYTDNPRYADNLVFETEAEEVPAICKPTVCLAPGINDMQSRFVYQGIDRTRDFWCMRGKMILGSSTEESDICIPLPMISRVHAKIEVDAHGTFLEDMNSTNGTQVNGVLLNYKERRRLQEGDVISLAGECYCFH